MSDTGADPLNSTVTLNVTNLTRKASVYASLSGPVLVSWLSAVIVLICFGTALYMILLGALYTKRQRQRAAGILILHSVFIEMYLCIVNFSIFVGTTIYAQKYTAVSRNFCNHTQFIYWSAFVTWNWSSLLLSVNRFVGMVFPHIYRKWTTKTAIVLSLMFPWLIGIMMSTLFYSGTVGSFDVMPPLGFCGLRLKYKWSLNMVNITGVSIPNALAGALYLALCGKMAWHKIRKKIDPMFAESQRAASATDRVVERRFTTAKMLLASILLYMACFLPGLLTAEFNPRKFFSDPIMQLWLRTLFYTGCTLNPVFVVAEATKSRDALPQVKLPRNIRLTLVFFALNQDYRFGAKIFCRRLLHRKTGPDENGRMSLSMRRTGNSRPTNATSRQWP